MDLDIVMYFVIHQADSSYLRTRLTKVCDSFAIEGVCERIELPRVKEEINGILERTTVNIGNL